MMQEQVPGTGAYSLCNKLAGVCNDVLQMHVLLKAAFKQMLTLHLVFTMKVELGEETIFSFYGVWDFL